MAFIPTKIQKNENLIKQIKELAFKINTFFIHLIHQH